VQGYPLRAFLICMVAYTTAQMDLALFGYAVPAIRAEFELSLSEVMAIVSIAFLIGGALLLGLGWMGDRVGRLPMFQFSLLGSSVLVTLISVAPGVIVLTVLRGASIAVGGLSYPITGAIITEEMPARLRGLFMGLLQIGYPLGWALASLWSMWLLATYGWRPLFLVGLISLPMVWVVRHYLREPPRAITAKSEQAPAALADLWAAEIRVRAATLFSAQFLFVWAYAASIFYSPAFCATSEG
jgi:AAHS family cis,cis-muconate transporter-like MFS transporter